MAGRKEMNCPECEGMGEIHAIGCGKEGPVGLTFGCELCGKTGKIDAVKQVWREEGRKLKDERLARGMLLGVEARQRKMDLVVLSKMERGILEPSR
jgi:hypothetical protein